MVIPFVWFAFVACRKTDKFSIEGILNRCEVTDATSPAAGLFTVGGGFNKTYYPDGQVKTIITRLWRFFAHVDSIEYAFTYQNGKAIVAANLRPYITGSFAGQEPADSLFPSFESDARSYSFEITVDPRTGNALTAGDIKFNYENGRLMSHSIGDMDYPAIYDEKGNIIKKAGETADVLYEYDDAKTAKLQLYYTSGYAINEMYNLMEILGWIPVFPKNLRKSHTVGDPDVYTYGTFHFTNHSLNADDFLQTFEEEKVITNKFSCTPVSAQ